jgi:hypothetical protein
MFSRATTASIVASPAALFVPVATVGFDALVTGVLAGSARCPTGRAPASQPSSLRLFAPSTQRRIRLTSPFGLRPVARLYYALC